MVFSFLAFSRVLLQKYSCILIGCWSVAMLFLKGSALETFLLYHIYFHSPHPRLLQTRLIWHSSLSSRNINSLQWIFILSKRRTFYLFQLEGMLERNYISGFQALSVALPTEQLSKNRSLGQRKIMFECRLIWLQGAEKPLSPNTTFGERQVDGNLECCHWLHF